MQAPSDPACSAIITKLASDTADRLDNLIGSFHDIRFRTADDTTEKKIREQSANLSKPYRLEATESPIGAIWSPKRA